MNTKLDFDKMSGLVPAVVQDARDKEVLMVGFMNREAFDLTLLKGYVTFYSRTRNQLWTKGESSGNRLRVVSALTDCDRDTLLVRVEVEGAGVVCHRGTRSCFTEPVASRGTAGKNFAGEETDETPTVTPAERSR
jgi:phosphoribosyl-AMP cyclohydrolase